MPTAGFEPAISADPWRSDTTQFIFLTQMFALPESTIVNSRLTELQYWMVGIVTRIRQQWKEDVEVRHRYKIWGTDHWWTWYCGLLSCETVCNLLCLSTFWRLMLLIFRVGDKMEVALSGDRLQDSTQSSEKVRLQGIPVFRTGPDVYVQCMN
jgi:hypothetical protein